MKTKLFASNASSSLTGRTPYIVCMFVVTIMLNSCVSGYYRDSQGYLRKVPESIMYGPRVPVNSAFLPPIPTDRMSYHVRLDKRPTVDSPDGIYWMRASSGQTWRLNPIQFWTFWREHTALGGKIKLFPSYQPQVQPEADVPKAIPVIMLPTSATSAAE